MTATPPESWEYILEHMNQLIEQSIVALDARQEALFAFGDSESPLADLRNQELVRIQAGFPSLDDMLAGIDAGIAADDQQVADGEQVLADYLERIEDFQRKLADWADRAIR